jgi:hypothetical protein
MSNAEASHAPALWHDFPPNADGLTLDDRYSRLSWLVPVNMDGDSLMDFVVAPDGWVNRYAYGVDDDGSPLWRTESGQDSGVIAGDLNGDSVPEVVFLGSVTSPGVRVVEILTGTPQWSFGTPSYTRGVLGDLTGDGLDDIAIASDGGGLYVLRNDGTLLWSIGYQAITTPVLTDLDTDGEVEIVFVADGAVRVLEADGTSLWEVSLPSLYGTPSLSRWDVTGDGSEEILFSHQEDLVLVDYPQGLCRLVSLPLTGTGGPLLRAQVGMEGHVNEAISSETALFVTADFDGDGLEEVVAQELIAGRYHVTVFSLVGPVEASIDCDPDTINLRSHGKWLTCYVRLPKGYDPRGMSADTILMESSLAPVLDPKYGFVRSENSYIVDHDGDGMPERMVKFDREAIDGLLNEGTRSLAISGKLSDGTLFEGLSDPITVIVPP